MELDRQKLIDKVVKLLALADSTIHSEEAETARRLAVELMAKHNVSIASIKAEDDEDFIISQQLVGFDRKDTTKETLLCAIANFNGVGMITGVGYYKFIGKPSDIEAFRYMLAIILHQQSEAFKAWKKLNKGQKSAPWYWGFALGVSSKLLEMERMSNEKVQTWGLVPVTPAKSALDWYKMNNLTTSIQKVSKPMNQDGFRAGQSVQLNKAVSQSNSRLSLTH